MDGDILEPVFLYAYTRAPKEFEDMMDGPALQHVRDRLASASYALRLDPSMAKVLVTPEQYPAVMEALQVWNHNYPRHCLLETAPRLGSKHCLCSVENQSQGEENGTILVTFATRGANS